MKKPVLIALSLSVLSACATTYDPKEVCTSEWIGKSSEKAVAELMDDTQGAVKALRKAAASYVEGKTPGPFQLWSLSNSLKKVENELTDGRGIKDLKILAQTCNDPKIVSDGLTSFVSELGLPPQMTRFVEELPRYKELMARHMRDITTTK